MTISSETSENSYTGNGSTATYAYGFRIVSATHLRVVQANASGAETVLAYPADYSVTGVGNASGGNVVLTAGNLTSGYTLNIRRQPPLKQLTDFRNAGSFNPESHEDAIDYLMMCIQDLQRQLDRCLTLLETQSGVDPVLPVPVAGMLLAWNGSADGLENAGALPGATALPLSAANGGNGDTGGPGGRVSANNTWTGTQTFRDNKFEITDEADPTKKVVFDVGTGVATGTTEKGLITGRQTLWIPAGAITPRTTNGPASGLAESATNKVMIRTLDYDAATAEFAQFAVCMPKSWDEGTLAARFHWSNAAGTGNVIWGIQAVAISDDDVIDAAFGTAVTVTDGVTAAGDLMRSAESAVFTVAGTPAAGDHIIIQVYRDATAGGDTFATDARLHGVEIYYKVDAANDV